jgi:hypothetical protein
MSAYIGTKAARKWTGQIGSGGVADNSVTTVPIQSATGLTNGEVYLFYVDRVDSNGVKTSSKEELVKGTLSGTNFTSCTRGVAGTAQSHSAGAVVEVLMTATHWNELVEALEVEHGSDGTHDNTKIALLAGTQTFTGAKTFTESVTVAGTASSSASIKLAEDTDNGTSYVELKAPATLSANKTFTLPSADGTANQALVTDGAGALSFLTLGGKVLQMKISGSLGQVSSALDSTEVHWGEVSITPTSATSTIYVLLAGSGLDNGGTGRLELKLRYSTSSGGTTGTQLSIGAVAGDSTGTNGLSSIVLLGSVALGNTTLTYFKATGLHNDTSTTWYVGRYSSQSNILLVEVGA